MADRQVLDRKRKQVCCLLLSIAGLLGTVTYRQSGNFDFYLSLILLVSNLVMYAETGGSTGEWGFPRKSSGARAQNVS